MPDPLPSINVVIPTLCAAERSAEIQRAIDSLRAQSGVSVRPIVVVNGERFDAVLRARLESDPFLRVHYVERGSNGGAQRVGRQLVESEFFAFLDDDDELLPDTLALRVQPLLRDGSLAAVVANGLRSVRGQPEVPAVTLPVDLDQAAERIMGSNWLASCGGLFRSARVGTEYFDGVTDYFEWTLIAVRLLLAQVPMVFVDRPVFRIHETPRSLSRSSAYDAAWCVFLERLLRLPLTGGMRRRVAERLAVSYNTRSVVHLHQDELREAWHWHLRTLRSPGGWRYLPYTLRLGRAAAAALRPRARV